MVLTAAEFVNANGEDLDSNLIDSLSVLAYAYPNLRDAPVSQPWFTDGLFRGEAALVIVLAGIAGDRPFFNDLLQPDYMQSRTISLPIAGEVNMVDRQRKWDNRGACPINPSSCGVGKAVSS